MGYCTLIMITYRAPLITKLFSRVLLDLLARNRMLNNNNSWNIEDLPSNIEIDLDSDLTSELIIRAIQEQRHEVCLLLLLSIFSIKIYLKYKIM